MAHELEWDPEVSERFEVRFGRYLPSGVTLSSPTATVQERTAVDPEVWSALDGVSTTGVTVGDDDLHSRTDQAVQFVISGSPSPTPDPGNHYRVLITATRSDGASIKEAGKIPLRIRPV